MGHFWKAPKPHHEQCAARLRSRGRGGTRFQDPSVIHLKGSVEIKTPVCVATGKGNEQLCAGYVILRTDEAEFHEDSGRIEARGNVTVSREK